MLSPLAFLRLDVHIPGRLGLAVSVFAIGWNCGARFCRWVELNCQVPFGMELECHMATARGNNQPQLSDLGLAAFFPRLELRCGTEVRNEFGTSVLVRE